MASDAAIAHSLSRGHLGLRQDARIGLPSSSGSSDELISDASPLRPHSAGLNPVTEFDRSFEAFRLTASSNTQVRKSYSSGRSKSPYQEPLRISRHLRPIAHDDRPMSGYSDRNNMPHEAKLLRDYDFLLQHSKQDKLACSTARDELWQMQKSLDMREENESALKQRVDQTQKQIHELQTTCTLLSEELHSSVTKLRHEASVLASRISPHASRAGSQPAREVLANGPCGSYSSSISSSGRETEVQDKNHIYQGLDKALPLWRPGETPLGSQTEESMSADTSAKTDDTGNQGDEHTYERFLQITGEEGARDVAPLPSASGSQQDGGRMLIAVSYQEFSELIASVFAAVSKIKEQAAVDREHAMNLDASLGLITQEVTSLRASVLRLDKRITPSCSIGDNAQVGGIPVYEDNAPPASGGRRQGAYAQERENGGEEGKGGEGLKTQGAQGDLANARKSALTLHDEPSPANGLAAGGRLQSMQKGRVGPDEAAGAGYDAVGRIAVEDGAARMSRAHLPTAATLSEGSFSVPLSADPSLQSAESVAGSNDERGAAGTHGKRGAEGSNGEGGAEGNDEERGVVGSNCEGGAEGTNEERCVVGCNGEGSAEGNYEERGAEGSNNEGGAVGSNGEGGAEGTNEDRSVVGCNGEGSAEGRNNEGVAVASNGERGAEGTNEERDAEGSNGERAAVASNGEGGAEGSNGERDAVGSHGEEGAEGSNEEGGAEGSNNEGGAVGSNGARGAVASNGEGIAEGSNGERCEEGSAISEKSGILLSIGQTDFRGEIATRINGEGQGTEVESLGRAGVQSVRGDSAGMEEKVELLNDPRDNHGGGGARVEDCSEGECVAGDEHLAASGSGEVGRQRQARGEAGGEVGAEEGEAPRCGFSEEAISCQRQQSGERMSLAGSGEGEWERRFVSSSAVPGSGVQVAGHDDLREIEWGTALDKEEGAGKSEEEALLLEQEEIMKLEQLQVLAQRSSGAVGGGAADGAQRPEQCAGGDERGSGEEGSGSDRASDEGGVDAAGPGESQSAGMHKGDPHGQSRKSTGGHRGGTGASMTIRKQWRHMKQLEVTVREREENGGEKGVAAPAYPARHAHAPLQPEDTSVAAACQGGGGGSYEVGGSQARRGELGADGGDQDTARDAEVGSTGDDAAGYARHGSSGNSRAALFTQMHLNAAMPVMPSHSAMQGACDKGDESTERLRLISEHEKHQHQEEEAHLAEQHKAEEALESKLRERKAHRKSKIGEMHGGLQSRMEEHELSAVESHLKAMLEEHSEHEHHDSEELQHLHELRDKLARTRRLTNTNFSASMPVMPSHSAMQASSFESAERLRLISEHEEHRHQEEEAHFAEQHKAEEALERKLRERKARRKSKIDEMHGGLHSRMEEHELSAVESHLKAMLEEHSEHEHHDSEELQHLHELRSALEYFRHGRGAAGSS